MIAEGFRTCLDLEITAFFDSCQKHGEEIKRQLENIGNAKLKCVSIVELATMYYNDTYEGNKADECGDR